MLKIFWYQKIELGCANRDEQMSNGYQFFLLDDEQRVATRWGGSHQPVSQNNVHQLQLIGVICHAFHDFHDFLAVFFI